MRNVSLVKKVIIKLGMVASAASLFTAVPASTFAQELQQEESLTNEEELIEEDSIREEDLFTESSGTGAESVSAPKEELLSGFVSENGTWIYYVNGNIPTGIDVVNGKINGVWGWYYIKDGVADPSFNGFARNEHGWWYIENGKVTFNKSEVTYGTVNGETAWWNVKGSKVIFNETIENNRHGWWYVRNGKVDFSKTSVEHNDNGWWYVKNGKVDFSYTGVKNNKNGWWYIRNGKVDFNYNGFAKNEHGWWYVENGKVTFNKSEVTYGTVNGETAWWNVKGSKVIFNESIENNRYGWWYVKNGKVDFSKTSVEHNNNGWWYVKNGKVDFGYNGLANNRHGWWYIRNGKVDFNYTGLATNSNGTWYVVNGKVDFNANGTRSIGGKEYNVSGGRITGLVDTVQSAMVSKARNYTTSTGYMILVDRAACKVGIFKGSGAYAQLDKYWSCCVGAYSTPTITGVYRLGSKGLYFNTGSTGRCWYYSQISGNYLFHSVIYDRSSSPVNIIDGTMGAHVSHGCVRLNVNNAKYIYTTVPSGSTIVIYN